LISIWKLTQEHRKHLRIIANERVSYLLHMARLDQYIEVSIMDYSCD
jgi:hypothetical protein